MKKFLFLTLSAFALYFVAVGEASACTCGNPAGKTDKELVDSARSNASAVFVGRVIKIVKGRDSQGKRLLGFYTAVFEVTEQWKGKEKRRVEVSFFTPCCMCDFRFAKGKEYLVYASDNSMFMTASVCGRTKETSDTLAKIDREHLGTSISTTTRN